MSQTVAAINIRRRTAAIALFRELRLEGVIVRHLPNDMLRAENAIVGFAHEICNHYEIAIIAVESAERITERQQRSYRIAREAFDDESVAIHEVPIQELMECYAFRPLRVRQQLRRIARNIWPSLATKQYGNTALDAALVGLCIQTKHLLSINPNER